jgi:hypothetical protein
MLKTILNSASTIGVVKIVAKDFSEATKIAWTANSIDLKKRKLNFAL